MKTLAALFFILMFMSPAHANRVNVCSQPIMMKKYLDFQEQRFQERLGVPPGIVVTGTPIHDVYRWALVFPELRKILAMKVAGTNLPTPRRSIEQTFEAVPTHTNEYVLCGGTLKVKIGKLGTYETSVAYAINFKKDGTSIIDELNDEQLKLFEKKISTFVHEIPD